MVIYPVGSGACRTAGTPAGRIISAFARVHHAMEPENRQVTTAAPAAPTAGPTYPTLLLRLWLARARLEARAGVRAVRPQDTADDRRLAAVLAAAGIALIMLVGCTAAGFAVTTTIVHIAVGFFAGLGGGLALLFGPDDDDCEAELAVVTGLLPEAKRVWDEQRAAARVARARLRTERAARRAAHKAERAARKQAAAGRTAARVNARGGLAVVADPAAAEDIVELVPVQGLSPVPAALKGNGAYAVPVLGEVHVGRILANVCHDKLPPVGQDKVVSAVVRIEDTNRDSRAVSVEIAGRKVGHLSRADARALRRRVGRDSEKFKCRAAIHAGWECGRVQYDLRLDVNLGADRPSGVVSV
jgi:hypothetical protein